MKGNRKQRMTPYICLVGILVLGLIGRTWFITYQMDKETEERVEEIRQEPELEQETVVVEAEIEEEIAPEITWIDPLAHIALDTLAQQYPNIKAWIEIPNTTISYPVVQGEDNEYFLHHDAKGDRNGNGAIYFDYRARVAPVDENTILYGHSLRNGSMFTPLLDYESLAFYKEAPIIYLKTEEGTSKWGIFAVMYINGEPSKGSVFYFNTPTFQTVEKFDLFLKRIAIRSLYRTAVEVTPADEIMTLGTCAYIVDEARIVVCAKKIPMEQEVDVEKAYLTEQPLYPDLWYKKRGLAIPDEKELLAPLVSDK